ncbi:hypothetical protein [Aminipila luticellarii]|uniref:Uncharacterized protein n=1 Tax=Aminipila luticellarii TaxID=2507160 RepID=A0A410PYG2_9FIRM|nr:hypothetical protein [Aminipila luticellarii]QAT43890.1 hypothetical protein EQM06_12005 [Aminipila luticellarii]
MEYVIGAIVGILYGGLAGFLKYIFLWRKLVKETDNTITMGAVTTRMGISYVTNVVVLLITFLIRNRIPFDFVALIIGTAFSLALTGKIFSLQKLMEKTKL